MIAAFHGGILGASACHVTRRQRRRQPAAMPREYEPQTTVFPSTASGFYDDFSAA
jgi:hypothetical protein